MSLFIAALVAACASVASAQTVTSTFPATPLYSKSFPSPTDLPYKVDSDTGLVRGIQQGFNICNSTTENQDSLCQTSYFNSAADFCIWAPPKPNSVVADTEGEMVAWCSKPGHGTRLIPSGALTGLQFIKTPDYIQAVGFLDQTQVDLQASDFGGEMDPHGADLRGNPMGGIVYSSGFNGKLVQAKDWTLFIGGGNFCFKACDPAGPNAAQFCQHIYDRIGCTYNVPNAAVNHVFESCLGDNQDFPGIYTSNGVVMTYTQPAESLGPITTMPYQPRIPASSSCVPFSSAAVYTGLPSPTTSGAASATATGTQGTLKSGSASPSATGSKTGTASSATKTSGAERMAMPAVSLMGLVLVTIFML